MENSKHIIKNFDHLASSALRKQALQIAEAGLFAIDTKQTIFRSMSLNVKKNQLQIFKDVYNLADFERIFVIGFGKASLNALTAVAEVLGEKIFIGFVIGLEEMEYSKPKIICRAGSHPLPSEKNLKYTQEMLGYLEDLTEKDLVICLVSGGGSALLTSPYLQSIQDEAEIFNVLTKEGASIQELNILRKHTSTLKGGQLAKKIYPATCLSLIFSDVPGDDISMVASGPTVKDTSTARDALDIIEKYDLLAKLNRAKINLVETPKESKFFNKAKNYLLVSSKIALLSMREKAEELGFEVKIYSEQFQGNATEIGLEVVAQNKKRGCVLGAGESTVKILGSGKGGRNLEMALSGLENLGEKEVFVALASDGHDNTEAAGAIVDETSLSRAQNLKLDPTIFLTNNDSFHFFEALGDLIITGQTGANVADFIVFLKN